MKIQNKKVVTDVNNSYYPLIKNKTSLSLRTELKCRFKFDCKNNNNCDCKYFEEGEDVSKLLTETNTENVIDVLMENLNILMKVEKIFAQIEKDIKKTIKSLLKNIKA